MSNIESPLKFPDPHDKMYWGTVQFTDKPEDYEDIVFNSERFTEDYESCLIELGLIMENIYDPVLRKKLDDLMRGVMEWIT